MFVLSDERRVNTFMDVFSGLPFTIAVSRESRREKRVLRKPFKDRLLFLVTTSVADHSFERVIYITF